MPFKLHIYLGAFVTYCDPILVVSWIIYKLINQCTVTFQMVQNPYQRSPGSFAWRFADQHISSLALYMYVVNNVNNSHFYIILLFLFPEAASRLKLLLSFAVGGLLGDVFLHLLPEAWAHTDKGTSSFSIKKVFWTKIINLMMKIFV